MSASVISGVMPHGKPHPAMKWSLLVALFVMVVSGVPRGAMASQPTVQAPAGQQSGGVFTGPYTFATYISCDNGPSFSGSYTNAIEGTHTFNFVGSGDGSLLVRIDGGGAQLISSCGNPAPTGSVASYTVTYSSSGPPAPTPTPTPTPVPHTPTPTSVPPVSGGGGTTSGGISNPGSGSSGSTSSGSSAAHTGVGSSSPAVNDSAAKSDSSNPGASSAGPAQSAAVSKTTSGVAQTKTPASQAGAPSSPASRNVSSFSWFAWLLVLVGLGLGVWRALQVPRLRAWREDAELGWRVRLGPRLFRLRQLVRQLTKTHGHDLPKGRGLSHHHHSGKLLAHHHTSYPALAFLLLLSTVLLGAYSMTGRADSVLNLTVNGPAPTTAATIDQPVSGQHVASATTTVRGTCPVGLMVEIYRNGAFAGSVLCDAGGFYNAVITLVDGSNTLVARDLDGAGQYGPDSTPVTVQYDAPPAPTPTPTPVLTPTPSPGHTPGPTPTPSTSPTHGPSATPASRTTLSPSARPGVTPTPHPVPTVEAFLLTTERHSYTGLQVGEEFSWTAKVDGGQSPYDLTWDWGDSNKDTIKPLSPGAITLSHRYRDPGVYRVVLHGRDAAGRESVLTLAAIVTGQAAATTTRPYADTPGVLAFAWPSLIMTTLVTLSFWLGEHHKLALWRYRGIHAQ